MKKDEVRNRIRVMTAWLDGKVVQYKNQNGYWCNAPFDIDGVNFDMPSVTWRIKPTEGRVPMGPDDIPPVCWLRLGSGSAASGIPLVVHLLVVGIVQDGVYVMSNESLSVKLMRFEFLAEHRAQYSADRKIWYFCWHSVQSFATFPGTPA